MLHTNRRSTLALAYLAIGVTAEIGSCYTTGPSLQKPEYTQTTFRAAGFSRLLDDLIDGIISSPEGWTIDNSSFSVQLTSSKETLYQRTHTAKNLGHYVGSEPTPFTGDTSFRIASCSKTFTVYALLLQEDIHLDTPISTYFPELLESNGTVDWVIHPDWKDITIGSLASQLSGLGRLTGDHDLAFDPIELPDPTSVGLPVGEFDNPNVAHFFNPCGKSALDRKCNASDIIYIAKRHPPIFAPNERSTYSNIGFSLLGLVLERAVGKSYDEIIQRSVLDPLNMHDTGLVKPKDAQGIIPVGSSDWSLDLGADNPTGGIYSTPSDLSKYMRSILTSALLPISVTHAWMKPHSWTAAGLSAYGMPWEMFRSTKLTKDKRPIDIITKSGTLTGYYSMLALIPEFDIGLSVLVAGSRAPHTELKEKVIATLIPAMEDKMRFRAKMRYEGFYAAPGEHWFRNGELNASWSMTLNVEETGPGLVVKQWMSNATDLLSFYGALKGMPEDRTKWDARLLPVATTESDWSGKDEQWVKESWRMVALPKPKLSSKGSVFDDYCFTDVDTAYYGGQALEEFYIHAAQTPTRHMGLIFSRGTRVLMWSPDDNDLPPAQVAHASENLRRERKVDTKVQKVLNTFD
ncbi:hypothetical protein MMC25_003805 [Agyrium rufum]|nr:hypothetical protein [Agyrium rufum]